MPLIAIVDDEMLIAEQLERNIIRFGHSSAGIATSYEEAIGILENKKPDLILLDIRLYGERNGIDIAEEINKRFSLPFIYLTSQMDATWLERAKRTRPAGYLTKPYSEETLFATIEICLFNSLKSTIQNKNEILLNVGKRNYLIPVNELFFLEADHVYTKVHLAKKTLLVRRSLNDIINELPADGFLRVHRSYIVNLSIVEELGATFIKVNGRKIPIGRSFREAVRESISM